MLMNSTDREEILQILCNGVREIFNILWYANSVYKCKGITILPFPFRAFLLLCILSFVTKLVFLEHREMCLGSHQLIRLGKTALFSVQYIMNVALKVELILLNCNFLKWLNMSESSTVDFSAYRNFIISNTTIRTTTYTDWQTRNGIIDHQVQQFVTPNILVRGSWLRTI